MGESRKAMNHVVRFGAFELEPCTGELRKHGVRIRLQGQPFAVLLMLVEKPGQLVTKEELQQRLWPSDTFVEFDRGIYNAIKRLRETLSDEAETPRYIETIPKRGYRFICPVDAPDLPPSSKADVRSASAPSSTTLFQSLTARRAWIGILAAAITLCLLVSAGIFVELKLRSSPPVPKVVDSFQITKDGLRKADAAYMLVSEGTRLYFQVGSLDDTEHNTALVEVSANGGETARIPVPFRNPIAFDFSQTHSELLLGEGEFGSDRRPLWVLPLPAGPPHRVGDILALDACWSADRRGLAFTRGKEVFVAEANGSEERKLATADDFDEASWIRFSPDGKRLRFSVVKWAADKSEVMEVASDGTGLHRLAIQGGCCGTWSADGKYYFYRKGRDIWVLPERRSLFGEVELGAPVQLTAGPLAFGGPTPSADGKHLFVVGSQQRIELVRYDSPSRQFLPFIGGISAGELEVSPDGQWVTYTTFPESDLWRSKIDGSERLQLSFAPINAHEPRWSPDGKQILFADWPHKILVVPANGGAPRQLMPADKPDTIGAGAWLPDGNSIIFGRHMGCSVLDNSCVAIYRLDLKTQQVSKIPDSDRMIAARLSHDGHYLTALAMGTNKVMLYDLKTDRWSELAQGWGSVVWSHDSRFVYLRKHETKTAELIRISVPDGKVQRVLDLTRVTLGGLWPDWISLLPDDSPLLMLDRSTEEIYRLDLQYQ
jgi:DNA-binding winged helix-turn-helix (wHTH) protein/Tol biopolymer transport system component